MDLREIIIFDLVRRKNGLPLQQGEGQMREPKGKSFEIIESVIKYQ